jgi:sulfur transfer protein SufE
MELKEVITNDMSSTQQEQAELLIETFEMFDDWEDRYGLLIDLGRKLPPMDPADKTEENRVHGCQSNVWMVARVRPDEDSTVIDFIADSDSSIVKGLIAVLSKLYSGQRAEDILSFDVEPVLEHLGLSQYLSMQRRNGLAGMVQRIKRLAATTTQREAVAVN